MGVMVRVGVLLGTGVTEPLDVMVGVPLGVAQVGSAGAVAVTGSGVLVGATVGIGVLLGGSGVLLGGSGVLLGGTGVAVGSSGVLLGGTAVALGGAGVSLGAGGAVTSTVITIGGADVYVAAGGTVTVMIIGSSGVSVGGTAVVSGTAAVDGSTMVASPLRLAGVLVARLVASVLVISIFAVGLGNGVTVADILTAFWLPLLLSRKRIRRIISSSAARPASIYCQRRFPVPLTLRTTVCWFCNGGVGGKGGVV